MNPHQLETLRRFLAAEHLDREAEAEAELRRLLRAAPRPAPSAGFSARVLTRASRLGLLRPAAGSAGAHAASRAWRWLSAGSLAATAALVLVVGMVLRGSVPEFGSEAGWTSLWVGGFTTLGHLVAATAAAWRGLLDFGETVTLSLQTPGTALTLLVALSLSMLAFRVLQELISRDRSSLYVQSR